ncbi:cell division protein ZapB [Duganella violaceipulchra]|nr:hypothetical protein [Duganella violaceicalia]
MPFKYAGRGRDSVDGVPRAAYSGGMIPDFQELSDKIDQLAEMTHALRRENAQLRQANAALVVENMGYQRKLSEATGRVEALLEKIPALDGDAEEEEQPENEDAR